MRRAAAHDMQAMTRRDVLYSSHYQFISTFSGALFTPCFFPRQLELKIDFHLLDSTG
jgi:hypothetical protein